MDLKQAVAAAKSHVSMVFQDEGITPPTLEEIEFDDQHAEWCVTVGFLRRDENMLTGTLLPQRKNYKIVRIRDENGEAVSVKNRDFS
jgi:hypothetical protein